MGETTISWTSTPVDGGEKFVPGYTHNAWWGCTKKILATGSPDPACVHCYAADWARRFDVKWGDKAERRLAKEHYLNDPFRWNRKAERDGIRRKVFAASMSDVMEGRRDLDEPRARLFDTIEKTPMLDWLLLTKRPELIMQLVPKSWHEAFPDNVWMGTSVVTSDALTERWPHLRKVPAVVRFLSMEPLMEAVDIREQLASGLLDWVIGGGESGKSARPMHPAWARSLRDQCEAAGVPFLFKQWGEWAPENTPDSAPRDSVQITHVGDDMTEMWRVGKKVAGEKLDGREHKAFPAPASCRFSEKSC